MNNQSTNVVSRRGSLDLTTEVRARYSCEEAWGVITDYNNLGAFMPNMDSSQVSRNGSAVLVDQTARSSVMPLLRFRLRLEFLRETPERLRFRQIRGSLRAFDGFWRVTRQSGGCHIYHQLRVAHRFPFPGPVLAAAVRFDVERIMPAILAELGRRTRTRESMLK